MQVGTDAGSEERTDGDGHLRILLERVDGILALLGRLVPRIEIVRRPASASTCSALSITSRCFAKNTTLPTEWDSWAA